MNWESLSEVRVLRKVVCRMAGSHDGKAVAWTLCRMPLKVPSSLLGVGKRLDSKKVNVVSSNRGSQKY